MTLPLIYNRMLNQRENVNSLVNELKQCSALWNSNNFQAESNFIGIMHAIYDTIDSHPVPQYYIVRNDISEGLVLFYKGQAQITYDQLNKFKAALDDIYGSGFSKHVSDHISSIQKTRIKMGDIVSMLESWVMILNDKINGYDSRRVIQQEITTLAKLLREIESATKTYPDIKLNIPTSTIERLKTLKSSKHCQLAQIELFS